MAGKVKTNEVILQSPNGLVEKTIALTNDGNVTIDSIYPVGSIYISTVNTNPSTYFGGTWSAFAQGRTLIGVGTSDQAFSAGATGGASTHTLTINEIPAHSHDLTAERWASSAFTASHTGWSADDYGGSLGTRTTSLVGSGQAHNNLQPYIVTYMWQRTA